ncbi:hypothetical protein B0H19DRAFT_1198623 [Mycena capillaripes]|nr:hypothetical protein B0H19DRAFT_1198623 [Mycena capillaripes]
MIFIYTHHSPRPLRSSHHGLWKACTLNCVSNSVLVILTVAWRSHVTEWRAGTVVAYPVQVANRAAWAGTSSPSTIRGLARYIWASLGEFKKMQGIAVTRS